MYRFFRQRLASVKGRPARRRFRPTVELFEDRLVPAVLTPSPNVADGQPGSLRDAVQTADENLQDNTINLQAGVYQLSLVNTAGHESKADQGDLNLYPAGHTITIQGAGAGVTIIDGGAIDRVFQVESGVTVVLRDLTIRNGKAQDAGNDGDQPGAVPGFGGGILNEGSLTLDHVVVEGNSAVGGNGQNAVIMPGQVTPPTGGLGALGGGIFNSGTLTLIQSTVGNNAADGGSGGKGILGYDGGAGSAGIGGGIYSDGTLNLVRSTVSDNTAGGGVGGDGGLSEVDPGGRGGRGGDGLGGGLYIDPNAGQTVVTDSTIAENFASGGVGGQGGSGGQGGNPLTNPGSNGGQGGDGGNGEGGGIDAQAIVTVSNSTIALNEAAQGNGGNGGPGGNGNPNGLHGNQGFSGIGDGGGVFTLEDPGEFVSVSSLIAGNTALYGAQDFHGTFASAANTLLGDAEGANNITGGVNGNLVGVAPLLGPLQDNGGPTETIALLPGSVAIDAGSNPLGLTTDQRGLARTVGATDIGAFEVQSVSPPTPPGVEPGVAPGNPPPVQAPVMQGPVMQGLAVQDVAAVTEHTVTTRVVKMHGRKVIQVYDASGVLLFTIHPAGPSFQVQTSDVNNDGYLDVLVTARHGRRVVTQAFSGLDGSPLSVSGM
jgi:hypothetical protein